MGEKYIICTCIDCWPPLILRRIKSTQQMVPLRVALLKELSICGVVTGLSGPSIKVLLLARSVHFVHLREMLKIFNLVESSKSRQIVSPLMCGWKFASAVSLCSLSLFGCKLNICITNGENILFQSNKIKKITKRCGTMSWYKYNL